MLKSYPLFRACYSDQAQKSLKAQSNQAQCIDGLVRRAIWMDVVRQTILGVIHEGRGEELGRRRHARGTLGRLRKLITIGVITKPSLVEHATLSVDDDRIRHMPE